MIILFSPSEAKALHNSDSFDLFNLPFNEKLSSLRNSIFEKYNAILQADDKTLCMHSGLSKAEELKELRDAPMDLGLCALYRYSGVAYKYLSAQTLDKNAIAFLNNHLLIFSNLFGPIFANSVIPYYKLKQGQSLDGFKVEVACKPLLNPLLDAKFENEFVLDLRAGFYEKFYSPKIPYATMQFYKNGKKMSHWAKAYRGKVVRALAQNRPNNQSEFESISFEGLHVKEILRQKHATHYCFDILDAL